ncbi:MAG TPA: hypothetical protein VM537_28980 [Anaerolineae bacterium]|nr:hypothetical protein [Anaerolineae bacterium]
MDDSTSGNRVLERIGALWPILAVVVLAYTMVLIAWNPLPLDREGRLLVGAPFPAEMWLRAMPVVVGVIVTMAGVRFGSTPLKNAIENAKLSIETKGEEGSTTRTSSTTTSTLSKTGEADE